MENSNRKYNGAENSEESINFQLYLNMVKTNEMTWNLFIQIMKDVIANDLVKSKTLNFELIDELQKHEIENKIKQQTIKSLETENELLKAEHDKLKRKVDSSSQNVDHIWNINSIYDIQYFNCPSCVFKNKSKQEIVTHACDEHPDSVKFLSNLSDKSLEDIKCPWNDFYMKFETVENSNLNENEDMPNNSIVDVITDLETSDINTEFEISDLNIEKLMCDKDEKRSEKRTLINNASKDFEVENFKIKYDLKEITKLDQKTFEYITNSPLENCENANENTEEFIKIKKLSVRLTPLSQSELKHYLKLNNSDSSVGRAYDAEGPGFESHCSEALKKHECDKCEKIFISEHRLKFHKEVVHEGLKKYRHVNLNLDFFKIFM